MTLTPFSPCMALYAKAPSLFFSKAVLEDSLSKTGFVVVNESFVSLATGATISVVVSFKRTSSLLESIHHNRIPANKIIPMKEL